MINKLTNDELSQRLLAAREKVKSCASLLSFANTKTYLQRLHGLFRALDQERPLHEELQRRAVITGDYVPPRAG